MRQIIFLLTLLLCANMRRRPAVASRWIEVGSGNRGLSPIGPFADVEQSGCPFVIPFVGSGDGRSVTICAKKEKNPAPLSKDRVRRLTPQAPVCWGLCLVNYTRPMVPWVALNEAFDRSTEPVILTMKSSPFWKVVPFTLLPPVATSITT